jgi:PAS domain S-box-containing protein
MIEQIQNYTSNLEHMVRERTRELEISKERYRDISRFLNSILDNATEYAIIALDFYGRIIEFNKGAERIYGWKKTEVLNRENIGITILPEDVAEGIQAEMSRRTRHEGLCEKEMTRLRKDGTVFPAYTTITAIKDMNGRATGFVEIDRDLTLRKSLERELRETKEFLENVLESSVDGIVTADLDGNITYLNRAMEEILGYERNVIMGRHVSSIYVRGMEEARDIMHHLKTLERTENYELEVKKSSGEIVPIITSLFQLRDEDGFLIGTAGIFKDMTEKKRLEERLKAAQVRLFEASKMRALGELVAGVAHELNNPLMASKTILYVILKRLKPGNPDRERLELIRGCNERIEKIVEHLREFSRQTQPSFQLLDINVPLENALIITQQQLINHNISLVKSLDENLPPITGDSNQLEQVFLNLISNARDAMDEIKDNRTLHISSFTVDDGFVPCVAVSFKDSGAGIRSQDKHKIFEPFFSTKPVGKGTGLGLSLCFGIIEAHGGRIDVKSLEGGGAEFTVIIPVKRKKKESENDKKDTDSR